MRKAATENKEILKASYIESLKVRYGECKKLYTKYINSYCVDNDGGIFQVNPGITFDDVKSAYADWFKLHEEFDKWCKLNKEVSHDICNH